MTSHVTDHRHRTAFLLYGVVAYTIFLGTFLYAMGFVGNLVVPKSIDSGEPGPMGQSIIINVLLLSLFVVQHTIMARPEFKEWWTRMVPKPIERSTFVLATCAVLILMFWQWRPLPEMVWSVQNSAGRAILYGLFAAGWGLVLYSSLLINHFDLFGLRQVILYFRGTEYHHPGFVMPRLYRVVRNPLMLGFLIAFWSTPDMSRGHLLFAVLTTGYILMGIWFEERDLIKILGDEYRAYRARTPMLIPVRISGRREESSQYEA